jgi:hypothetical protein
MCGGYFGFCNTYQFEKKSDSKNSWLVFQKIGRTTGFMKELAKTHGF